MILKFGKNPTSVRKGADSPEPTLAEALTRREPLGKFSGLFTAFVIGVGLVCASDVAADKPLNFVIVLADDMGTIGMGCYGSPNLSATPNIDRLAEEGLLFTNMFVAAATCSPVRAELYTGLFPEKNGVNRNHNAANLGTKSVPHYLGALGYRVGIVGKTHIRPIEVYPFERLKGVEPQATASKVGPDDWTDTKAFMSRDRDQPFCLVVGSVHPHNPWDSGDPSPWEEKELLLPETFIDTPETREEFRRYLAEVREFDRQVEAVEAMVHEQGIADRTAIIVLGENGIGVAGAKWSNWDPGVRSACIIKWPGGPRGERTDALAHYCDILPTMIDAAGGEIPAVLDGMSLLPLIRGETQNHREHAFFVHNNRTYPPERSEPHFSLRGVTDGRYKLLVNFTPDNLYAVDSLNGPDFGRAIMSLPTTRIYLSWIEAVGSDPTLYPFLKRIRHYPKAQLFDLNADPWELTDLASDPAYAAQVDRLRDVLDAWMLLQGDNGYPEGEGGIVYRETDFAPPLRP